MKLYTKTGDDGSTGLFGGARISKHHARVAAYGEVDELNAVLGLIVTDCTDVELVTMLRQIQSDLFELGAELASPQSEKTQGRIRQTHVTRLETWIDSACHETPPVRTFILPGGTMNAARLHFARAVCRRAERATVALTQQESLDPLVVIYLNRLSDLCFALARRANHRAKVADVPWTSQQR